MLLRKRSRGRKVYLGVRSLVAIAAILYLGGTDEFFAMGRSLTASLLSVIEAPQPSPAESPIHKTDQHDNDT